MRRKAQSSRLALAALAAALAAPLPAAAQDGGPEACTEPEGVGNEGYQSADDWDDDGLLDWDDNCPRAYDPDAWDVDADGVGDPCDDCPAHPDPDQWDEDGDGIGDACDNDADGDGVLDAADNCAAEAADGGATARPVRNPGQEDLDGDGVGDACDPDLDGDGLDNAVDPCPCDAANDGTGCNSDPDGDGRPTFNLKTPENTINDNCPTTFNPDQADLDGDGEGDACDPDVDGDGALDPIDDCPGAWNPGQEDSDRDGLGDACDDAFCFVVAGDESSCLDPSGAFAVLAPDVLDADTGDTVRLRLFANREDAHLAYSWSLVSGPSIGALANADGEAACSTPFEYHYVEGAEPTFTPNKPGAYSLRVTATLLDEPGAPSATDEMTIEAWGVIIGSGDACNCSAAGAERTPGRPVGFTLLLAVLAAIAGISIFRAR